MEYKHFSHPHYLKLYQLPNDDVKPRCSGCECSILSGSTYYCCSECNFFLHQQCVEAPLAVEHPSHPLHHLTLLPYPTSSAGTYRCAACGLDVTAFSYSCPLCSFDVHVPCALWSETLESPSTHPHALRLTYALPHHGDKRHNCSICGEELDYKLWTYNCFGCEFRTHCHCAVAALWHAAAAAKEEAECGGCEEVRTVAEEGESERRREESVGEVAEQMVELQNQAMRNQVEMYKLQLEMEMVSEMAKMMASFNISSLI